MQKQLVRHRLRPYEKCENKRKHNVNISKAETYQIESALMNIEVYLTSNIKIV